MIEYVKQHNNRDAEQHLKALPTQIMIRSWKKQEDQLEAAWRLKQSQQQTEVKLPGLEEEVNDWIEVERISGHRVWIKKGLVKARTAWYSNEN